jgi:hypothetical protein
MMSCKISFQRKYGNIRYIYQPNENNITEVEVLILKDTKIWTRLKKVFFSVQRQGIYKNILLHYKSGYKQIIFKQI